VSLAYSVSHMLFVIQGGKTVAHSSSSYPTLQYYIFFLHYFLRYLLRTFFVLLPTAENYFWLLDRRSLTRNYSRNSTSLAWILCLNIPRHLWYPRGCTKTQTPEKRRRRRRGRRSGALVRPRRRAYHPSLPSTLLANVQSLLPERHQEL
jgi:hypothetical protein